MPDLIQTIKKAALEAVEQRKPTKVVVGKVESLSPLEIRINQRLLIDEYFYVLSGTMKNLLENSKLSVGDKLIIIKNEGGQVFFVMDIAT